MPISKKTSRLLVALLATAGAVQANAALSLPALDTSDIGAVATWLITGITAVFAVKATPVVVAWGVGKLSSFLGRH